MAIIPAYTPPDFTAAHLVDAPVVTVEEAPADGVVPRNFHGTSKGSAVFDAGAAPRRR